MIKWYVVWVENYKVDSIVMKFNRMSEAAAQCDKLNHYIPETSASGFEVYSEESIDDEVRKEWETRE